MQRITRAGAVLATTALAVTTLGAVPATADPSRSATRSAQAPSPGPAASAASWVRKELTDGLFRNTEFDFDDVGLSIDAALGTAQLTKAGTVPAPVRRTTDAVAAQLDGYTGSGGERYGGAIAKSLVLAQVADRDPRTFGGTDLVDSLEGQILDSGPAAGRLVDTSEWGNYANTIGQAYAVRGLAAAGSGKAQAALDFLVRQQCPDGYFRLYFDEDLEAAEQGCRAGEPGSAPDTDSTALVVMNLAEAAEALPAASPPMRKAGAWLRKQQRKDGSFGGGTSTSGSNANSTGLAGHALSLLGRKQPAARAGAWVRGLQPADLGQCRSPLTKDKGAIAYDRAALRAGRKDGLVGGAEDQWRRTTSQALLGLANAPAPKGKLRVTAARKQPRGARVRVQVRGLARGQNACLFTHGSARRVTGNGKVVTRVLKVAPKAAKQRQVRVRVRTLDGSAQVRLSPRRR